MYNLFPMPVGGPGDWYKIANKTTDEATIHIFDGIGWFGVEARTFVKDLEKIDAKTIHVHINSPGGDVFDGVAIANALRSHSAKIVVHIDALAASIASIIALAGDEIRMADNAMFMIHNPFMMAAGDAAEFRKAAELLDTVRDTLVATYEKSCDLSREQIIAAMDAETWYSAKDALEAGFIHEIDSFDEDAPENRKRHDLSNFKNPPENDPAPDTGPDIEMMRRRLRLANAQ